MPRNSVDLQQYPARYNHLFMDWWRRQLNLSIRGIARDLCAREATVADVFRGIATSKKVYPVAEHMRMDWAVVHDLTLVEEDFPGVFKQVFPEGAHLIAPTIVVSNSR